MVNIQGQADPHNLYKLHSTGSVLVVILSRETLGLH